MRILKGLIFALTLAACSAPPPQPPAPPVVITQAQVNESDHFPVLVGYVFVSEGYTYTNITGDPGGPTKYGITLADVRHYLDANATAADVRALSLADAKTIYREHYWNPIGDGSLPLGVNYSVFDYAVNAGVARSLSTLGQCSPGLPLAIIQCVYEKRLAFQMGLPSSYDKFKRGWKNRITAVHHMSIQMAGGQLDKADLLTDLFLIPRIGRGKAIRD
jgi:lysozyme family protein